MDAMKNDINRRNPAHVQSVDRAIRLLEHMAQEKEDLGLTEIANALAWPKSTVHGLISTLCCRNYVEQSPGTGRYRLGLKLFELGSTVERSWDIHAAARHEMRELNCKLGAMVQLATESSGEVLYIEKLDSADKMRTPSNVGEMQPMHCTALGKAQLAYKSTSEVKRIIAERGLCAMTPRTITDPGVLDMELSRVRQQGYAIADREFMDNLRCIAAPIFNHSGKVKHAISISGAADDFRGIPFERAKEHLLMTARNISFAMGYRGQIEK